MREPSHQNPVPDLDPDEWQRALDRARVISTRRKGRRRMLLLWFLIGPGILTMLGENDAGSMITYAETGARYGFSLFLILVPITFVMAYVVQEMTVRLGSVSHRGHGELIFSRFGHFWGIFSLADLTLGNLLTLITEFIGIGIGLSYFGVPLWVSVPGAVILNALIATSGRYWTWERVTIGLAGLNLIFIPLALSVHPHWGRVVAAIGHPSIPGGFTAMVFFLIIANIGATVTPWMIFFEQGAVVDKGMVSADIKHGRLDTLIGATMAALGAMGMMLLTATVLFSHHINPQNATFAQALSPYVGHVIAALFAVGLTEAGFVAATTISLSSSWAFTEVLGLPRSLNQSVRQAPIFYLTYFGEVLIAGAVVLIPRAPLTLIALLVQVVNTVLMPPALMFLLLFLNDRALMGANVNTRLQNISVGTIAVLLFLLSAIYGVTLMFPHLI